MLPRNVGTSFPNYKAAHHRRQYSILKLEKLQLRITKCHIPIKIFYSDEGSSTFLRNTGNSITL